MKVTFTLSQLRKLLILQPAVAREVLALAENESGKGEATELLREAVGLVKVVGSYAFVLFEVDGVKPMEKFPMAGKKKSATELQTMMVIWRDKVGQKQISGKDLAALKLFASTCSIEEFEALLKRYLEWANYTGLTDFSLAGMWHKRDRLLGRDTKYDTND